MAAFAVHRFRFFGRESVSFLLLLPIALPGIITGMALNSFYVFAGIGFSIWTIVIGHTTFCIVVVYNNVLARLRRTQGSLIEASMDLGRGRLADVPLRRLARPVDGARRGRPARLRALLRRGDRDDVHCRRHRHLPIFIFDNIGQGSSSRSSTWSPSSSSC